MESSLRAAEIQRQSKELVAGDETKPAQNESGPISGLRWRRTIASVAAQSSTEVNEIQDEEGGKSVATPFTAQTIHALLSYGVAVCSS